MIVDDDPFCRSLMSASLRKIGIKEIIESLNGEDGFYKFCEIEQIDLIFIDKRMPVMDGVSLCQHIRDYEKIKTLKRTPIIGMSGDYENKEFISVGANEVHQKPLSKDKLIEVLEKYL